MDLRSSSSLSNCQRDLDSDCLLHNLLCLSHFQLRCNVFLRAGSLRTQHRSEHRYNRSVCVGSDLFSFYSIHLIMKSSCFRVKSLGKSSDCVDFAKSMDLLDLSENIKFSPISIFNSFYKLGYNYNYHSKSSVLDFKLMAKSWILRLI